MVGILNVMNESVGDTVFADIRCEGQRNQATETRSLRYDLKIDLSGKW